MVRPIFRMLLKMLSVMMKERVQSLKLFSRIRIEGVMFFKQSSTRLRKLIRSRLISLKSYI